MRGTPVRWARKASRVEGTTGLRAFRGARGRNTGRGVDQRPVDEGDNMSFSSIRPQVYTVAEVAFLFAISPRLVRNLIRKGELPALRIGRSYRIPRKAAASYLARALPPTLRSSSSKSRPRQEDAQTGFLFPVGIIQ